MTATDAAGNATTQTVTLSVTNLDEVAPGFSSGTSASVTENVAAATLVYTAVASDPATDGGPSNPLVYSLGGTDAAAFTLNTSSGAVTINASPNYEAQSSYSFDVTATDAAGNATTQTVTLSVTNLDEVAPVFSSGTSASVTENVAAATLVYTAVASDPAADGGPSNPLVYSLGGTDAAAFTLNTSSGAVTINASPNYEAQVELQL